MKLWTLSALALVSAFAIACQAPAPPPAEPRSDADAPKRGGQLNSRIPSDPYDWDLSFAGKTTPNEIGIAYATNSLLGFKAGPDVAYTEMILRPELAERWEASPDGKTFTFHLRKGVKYANVAPVSGRELTSADVKWTWEYWSRTGEFKDSKLPKGQLEHMFEGMIGVETPDRYTAVIRFAEPFVPLLAYAASEWNPVMAKEVFQLDGHLKDKLIGTGPFQLDAAASQKGSRWVWKKNPDYWDPGKPYLDEIRWLVLADESTMNAALSTRQLDVTPSLAFQAMKSVEQTSPSVKLQKVVQPRGYHLYLSQAHPGPLKDLKVRQALTLAVDREEINRGVAGGLGEWAVPGAMAGLFTDAEAKAMQPQDPERAKRLLAEAGYPNGFTLDWPYTSDESRTNLSWYQIIQAQFKRVGVTVNLSPIERAMQRARKYSGDYDLDSGVGLGGLDADIDSMLYGPYRSGSSANWPKIVDPELDRMLDTTRRETDPIKRREALRAAAKRIVDQAWGIEIIYPPIWYGAQPYVRGFHPQFGIRSEHHTDIWLDK